MYCLKRFEAKMIPIDTKDIKGRVYKTLKGKIINLDLKPGEILSDRKLSEEMKVSRTPVREALNLLVKENYVKQLPRFLGQRNQS